MNKNKKHVQFRKQNSGMYYLVDQEMLDFAGNIESCICLTLIERVIDEVGYFDRFNIGGGWSQNAHKLWKLKKLEEDLFKDLEEWFSYPFIKYSVISAYQLHRLLFIKERILRELNIKVLKQKIRLMPI